MNQIRPRESPDPEHALGSRDEKESPEFRVERRIVEAGIRIGVLAEETTFSLMFRNCGAGSGRRPLLFGIGRHMAFALLNRCALLL